MATQLPRSQRQPVAPAKADDPTAVPSYGSDKTTDPFPYGVSPGRPFIRPHRLAQLVPGHAADDDEIYNRLRAGSPKSGAKHVRLTDSVQVGENEFEPRVHWAYRLLEWLCLAPAVFLVLYFGWQFAGRPWL